MRLAKIVSGGQTGIDRGTLDAALAWGFPCGGWCPPERLAEDGRIPDCYPVIELKEGGYRQRTLRNVLESDGTAILYFSQIEGGTEETLRFCIDMSGWRANRYNFFIQQPVQSLLRSQQVFL
jgi:Circularly permutated YpsA SLOG family